MYTLSSIRGMCPRCFQASWKMNSLLRYFGHIIRKRQVLSAGNNNILDGTNQQSMFINSFVRQRLLVERHAYRNPCPDVFLTPINMSGGQGGLPRFYSTAKGIQKQVSSLVAKRPIRKKAPSSKTDHKEITAYAVAEEINLSQLQKALKSQGLYTVHELPLDVTNGLYAQAKYSVDEEPREMYFFSEGSAVFWNVPEVERREVVKFVQKYSEDPYDMNLVIFESEHMPFRFSQDPTTLVGEVINICETETEEGSQVLEKFSFSNALSHAVSLGMWEASLEKFVDLIEPITQDLRDGRKIRMSRREVLQGTGELFALRHVINLSSDLLDTPDFYWDREALEPLYLKACNHLNIARRTKVMNERLSHLCELMELLSTHLNDTHHTRLEWMIIILIMVEVVFEIIHYIERYVDSHQMSYTENQPYEHSGHSSRP